MRGVTQAKKVDRLREIASMLAQSVLSIDDVAVVEDAVNGVLVERGLKYRLAATRAEVGELESVAVLERKQILKVLSATGGNKSKAAEILGMDRRTLHRKLQQMRGEST